MKRWSFMIYTLLICTLWIGQISYASSILNNQNIELINTYAHSKAIYITTHIQSNKVQLITAGSVNNRSDSKSIPYEENGMGKLLAGIVYLVALIVLCYFLYWLGKHIYRFVQPSFIDIPIVRKRVSSLKHIAMQSQAQVYRFLKSTHGESGAVAHEANEQLQRLIQQLDDIAPSLVLSRYSVLHRVKVEQLVAYMTAQIDQIEQNIRLYTANIQKIEQAETYVGDQLDHLKENLQQARRQLQEMQSKTGFSLKQLDNALVEAYEQMETIRGLRRLEPLQAAQLIKQVMTKTQDILLDLHYVQKYREQINIFLINVQYSQQQAEAFIEQHQLIISWSIDEVIAESINQIPELQQAMERGDMKVVRLLYDDMEQRIQQAILHIQQLVEKKQQIRHELPLLEDKLSYLEKATDQRTHQWSIVKERYSANMWKEQYQYFAHMQYELQQSHQQIIEIKQLIHPERQAYDEADHILTGMKHMIKRAENILRTNDDYFQQWNSADKPMYVLFNECVYKYERIDKIVEQSKFKWENHAKLYEEYERIVKQHDQLKNKLQQNTLHIYRLEEQLTKHNQSLIALKSNLQRLLEQKDRTRAYAGSLASDYKQAMHSARIFMKNSQFKSYEQEYQLYVDRYVNLMQTGDYEKADEPLQNIRQINDRLHAIVQTGKMAQKQQKYKIGKVSLNNRSYNGLHVSKKTKKSSSIDDDDIDIDDDSD